MTLLSVFSPRARARERADIAKALEERLNLLWPEKIVSWDEIALLLKNKNIPAFADDAQAIRQVGYTLAQRANNGAIPVFVLDDAHEARYRAHLHQHQTQSHRLHGIGSHGFPNPFYTHLEPHGLCFHMRDVIKAVKDSCIPMTPKSGVRFYLTNLPDLYTPITEVLENISTLEGAHRITLKGADTARKPAP